MIRRVDNASSKHHSLIPMHYWAPGAAILLWTMLMSASWIWQVYHARSTARDMAALEAHIHLNNDLAFRLWATEHGGVYVQVNERTLPNPYLAHIPERDLESPSGKKLTLMNPAYMLRQFQQEYAGVYKAKAHITSLKPLRPGNGPDPWEMSALRRFETGAKEVCGTTTMGGEDQFRLMRPMATEEGCLKCHRHQGYKRGDIRGGVSVSVPLAPYRKLAYGETVRVSTVLGVLWLLGTAGILIGYAGLRGREKERRRAYEALEKSEKRLRSLSSRIMQTNEEERMGITRDIHAGIGQSLCAIKLMLEGVCRDVNFADRDKIKKTIESSIETVRMAMGEVRGLEIRLHPLLLYDLGILATISWLCRNFRECYEGIQIETRIAIEEKDIPQQFRIAMYRIIQEAFSMAAETCNARLISLSLEKDGDRIRLSVSHDGDCPEEKKTNSREVAEMEIALTAMKEWTTLSGGNFSVDSEMEHHSAIEADWPLQPEGERQGADGEMLRNNGMVE